MNFYFNPFTNESVWELPEGATAVDPQISYISLAAYQAPITINPEDQVEVEEIVEEEDYYDEEAWQEDELVEKLIWDKMKQQQLEEWLKRPARQQVANTRRDTAYVEGNYDYNIWFDKYLTDRKEEREK